MKKSKIVLALFWFLSLFIQIMYFGDSDVFYRYGFAIGIDSSIRQPDIGIDLIYVLLPIMFTVFLLSGSVERMRNGYGKLLIIRNYSKTKMYLKNSVKCNVILLSLVFLQIVLYSAFGCMFTPCGGSVLKSVIMYFAVLSLVITLQGVLELFTMPHIANIIVFIYCYVSYFAVQITPPNVFVKILLFPCLMFGMQNGAVSGEHIYFIFLGSAVILNVIFTSLGVLKFKKTDIF